MCCNSPFMCDHTHPYYSNHSTQVRLKSLSQDFHDVNPTCKHAFINLKYLTILPCLYFACHHFSATPHFDVYFVTIFENMSWWHDVKCGVSLLMIQLKIEWQIWHRGTGLPDWSTNMRWKEGRSDPRLSKSWNRKKYNRLDKQLLKHSFQLLILILSD